MNISIQTVVNLLLFMCEQPSLYQRPAFCLPQEADIKLSDFGFAKIDDGNLQTPYFTPYYVAPQVRVSFVFHTCKMKSLHNSFSSRKHVREMYTPSYPTFI